MRDAPILRDNPIRRIGLVVIATDHRLGKIAHDYRAAAPRVSAIRDDGDFARPTNPRINRVAHAITTPYSRLRRCLLRKLGRSRATGCNRGGACDSRPARGKLRGRGRGRLRLALGLRG